jgi:hypothetical protein
MNSIEYIAVWKSGASIKWRGLSMKEFKDFSNRLAYEQEMLVYTDLFKLVGETIEGKSLNVPAGIVFFLGETLLKRSVFNGDEKTIKQVLTHHRNQLSGNYFEQCKTVMAAVFKYSFEDIDSWDDYTFFDRLAKAEMISGENLEPKGSEPEKPVVSNDHPDRKQKKPLTSGQQVALERRMASGR